MDYTIKVSIWFEPKQYLIKPKLVKFLKKSEETDLILLIDDGIPGVPLLLTLFKTYNSKKPGEFVGTDPVFLVAPNVQYHGMKKIITPKVSRAGKDLDEFGRIKYIPDLFYRNREAVNVLRNESAHNMNEFRIYADLLENEKLEGMIWDPFKEERSMLENIMKSK